MASRPSPCRWCTSEASATLDSSASTKPRERTCVRALESRSTSRAIATTACGRTISELATASSSRRAAPSTLASGRAISCPARVWMHSHSRTLARTRQLSNAHYLHDRQARSASLAIRTGSFTARCRATGSRACACRPKEPSSGNGCRHAATPLKPAALSCGCRPCEATSGSTFARRSTRATRTAPPAGREPLASPSLIRSRTRRNKWTRHCRSASPMAPRRSLSRCSRSSNPRYATACVSM